MTALGSKKAADIVQMKTALYRHYDADGALLYVGVSLSPIARTSSHARSSDWFYQVARIDVEWHKDRMSAMKSEVSAIRLEFPKKNRAHSCRGFAEIYGPQLVQSLSDYLKNNGISAREFAQRVGLSPAGLHGIMHKRNIPSLPVAIRIEDATGGAVPARAWLDT